MHELIKATLYSHFPKSVLEIKTELGLPSLGRRKTIALIYKATNAKINPVLVSLHVPLKSQKMRFVQLVRTEAKL